jgi:hypothetical protein
VQYLLAVLDDHSVRASDDMMEEIGRFNQELRDQGRLHLAVGLADPGDSVVIDNRRDAGLITPGPLHHDLEGFMIGLWVFSADSREEAMAIATRASRVCDQKLELRPIL